MHEFNEQWVGSNECRNIHLDPQDRLLAVLCVHTVLKAVRIIKYCTCVII